MEDGSYRRELRLTLKEKKDEIPITKGTEKWRMYNEREQN